MTGAILVTGASGLLGRAVTERLVVAGHSVRALVRGRTSKTLVAAGAEPVLGDVLDLTSITASLTGVEAVVHCAGLVGAEHVPRGVMFRVNADGSELVARAMVACGVARLVHVSSLRVYGLAPRRGCNEDDPFCAVGDPYADSKIEAEHRLRAIAKSTRLRLQILRPGSVYGPGDRHFVPPLVQALTAHRVRLAGEGDNRLDPIDAAEVAEAVLRALARQDVDAVNLASSEPVTARRLVDAVARASRLQGGDVRVRSVGIATVERLRASWGESTELPRVVLDLLVLDRRMDLARMHDVLGLRTSFDDTIERAVATCMASRGRGAPA